VGRLIDESIIRVAHIIRDLSSYMYDQKIRSKSAAHYLPCLSVAWSTNVSSGMWLDPRVSLNDATSRGVKD